MDEEWESPHAGTKEDLESQWAGAGELARGQEPSGLSGSGQPGIPETGKGQARGQEGPEELRIGCCLPSAGESGRAVTAEKGGKWNRKGVGGRKHVAESKKSYR